MKRIILFLFSAQLSQLCAQEIVRPTDSLLISGKIKKEWLFTQRDLDTFHTVPVGDVQITNHLGVQKGIAKNMKGIPVKALLDRALMDAANPKLLSEFYFTFIASDNYKTVFSWNEIFNTETGNHLFIITEKDGKKIKDTDDRILFMATADFRTGRRYIKGLNRIIVSRVN